MTPKLSTIPTELVELIAAEIEEPADLSALRSVCRNLKEKTLERCGRVLFPALRTDLSGSSFQKLKEVSEYQQIRHYVQHLHVREPPEGYGKGLSWPRHPSGRLRAGLPEIEMLRTILLHGLVNCRSFHFRFQHETEDVYRNDRLSPSDAITVFFTVIAETGLPVKAFHVPTCVRNAIGGRSTWLKQLDDQQVHLAQFKTGWTHLEELVLEYMMLPPTLDWTTELVLGATNLQKLSLSPSWKAKATRTFSSFLEGLSSADRLPRLQELHLAVASITEAQLSQTMLCFRDSLRVFSFHYVRMIRGRWASALKMLGTKLLSLQQFEVMFLLTSGPRLVPGGDASMWLTFPRIRDDPMIHDTQGGVFKLAENNDHSRINGVTYRGSHVGQALETVVRSIFYATRG